MTALLATWGDLGAHYAADRAGLVDAPFAVRRQWLDHLGIVVRVWPRGYGRLLEVMSSVDPDRAPRHDLPALSATEKSKVTKHQLVAPTSPEADRSMTTTTDQRATRLP